jgi:hypothetical protein
MAKLVWFRKVLEDIGFEQNEPTLVHEDNVAAIAFLNGRGSHSRTKRFDRRLQFNVDVMARVLVKLQYCPTKEQVADILTKALSLWTHSTI